MRINFFSCLTQRIFLKAQEGFFFFPCFWQQCVKKWKGDGEEENSFHKSSCHLWHLSLQDAVDAQHLHNLERKGIELWKKKFTGEIFTQGYPSMTLVLPEKGVSSYAWPILSQAPSSTDREIVIPCFGGKFNGPSGIVPSMRDVILMQKSSRYSCGLFGLFSG